MMIPNFISDVPVVYITKETHTTDTFVTSIYAADSDLDIDNDYIRWNITDDTKLIPWDYPNVTRTDRLFYIDGCKCFIFSLFNISESRMTMRAFGILPMVPQEILPMVPLVANGTIGNTRTLNVSRLPMVPLVPMLPLVETLVPMVPLVVPMVPLVSPMVSTVV